MSITGPWDWMLKILLANFWKVLKREGISQEGYATAEEFWGDTDKNE